MPNIFYLLFLGIFFSTSCSKVPPADDGSVTQIVADKIDAHVIWRQGFSTNPDEKTKAFIQCALANALTADSAIQIALLNNPKIQALFEELGIAQANVIEAGLLSNPSFEIELRYPHVSGLRTNIEYLITSSLLDIFLIPLRSKVAAIEFEQAKLRVSNEILDLAFTVRETFYKILGERQKLQSTKSIAELAAIERDISSKQRAAGNINDLEFQIAQHRAIQAEIEQAQSEGEIIRLKELLNRLLGFAEDIHLPLPEELPNDNAMDYKGFDLEALEALALEERLDVQISRCEITRLQKLLGLKDWWTYTDLTGGLAGEKEPDGANLIGPGFSGELPIFNYGQAARLHIFSQLRQAWQRSIELRIHTLSQVREAHKILMSYAKIITGYQDSLLPVQDKISDAAESLYNVMGLGIDKLLESKRQQIAARQLYSESLTKYLVARVDLDRAVGGNLFRLLAQQACKQKQGCQQECLQNPNPLHREDFTPPADLPTPAQQQHTASSALQGGGVITPNVGSLPWTMAGDIKVFYLTAEPIRREFAPGFWVNCWGYNGSSPGPTIEAIEGDTVRIVMTNHLEEPTTVHWHGVVLPNAMDGVAGLTQRAIAPGESFTYEFTLKQNGTFMYHPHADEMTQVAMGMMGFFIIHPKEREEPPIARDFALFLHEWRIPLGAETPEPNEMLDFNIFTFNSVLFPKIDALVAKQGDRVRIRLANVMMNSHPIHLHGHEFMVTRRGARRLPHSAQYSEVTVNVAPGETRDIEFIADNPGDWAFHCHKSHHTMNQMRHDLPNLTGIHKSDIDKKIERFFPSFMGLMGINGMGEMYEMYGEGMPHKHMVGQRNLPENLAPIGSPGPFGVIEMGGMFTILKVREGLTNYADPGWYRPISQ